MIATSRHARQEALEVGVCGDCNPLLCATSAQVACQSHSPLCVPCTSSSSASSSSSSLRGRGASSSSSSPWWCWASALSCSAAMLASTGVRSRRGTGVPCFLLHGGKASSKPRNSNLRQQGRAICRWRYYLICHACTSGHQGTGWHQVPPLQPRLPQSRFAIPVPLGCSNGAVN